ncbi:MAG: Type 1 glutamine amidotransferase-like domain-containing protein [Thermoplasmatales archaeon]|nr:Type 1 glutamine amidotransferase-like domain-containing protein [Thermoplasmatales archaeon]
MTPSLIVLQGGEDVKERTNKSLFTFIARTSRTKKVLVIPWTSKSKKKENQYGEIYREYFLNIGFEKVIFLEKDDSVTEMDNKFSAADVVYLPGGDPEILKKEIESFSIQKKLKRFKGTIIGNSAGAIVLSRGGEAGGKFYEGLGLVNIYVKVHFNFKSDQLESGKEGYVIGIPEDGWIAIQSNSR